MPSDITWCHGARIQDVDIGDGLQCEPESSYKLISVGQRHVCPGYYYTYSVVPVLKSRGAQTASALHRWARLERAGMWPWPLLPLCLRDRNDLFAIPTTEPVSNYCPCRANLVSSGQVK